MVSLQGGSYPYFVYDFADLSEVYHLQPEKRSYPRESIMGYIAQHHPKYAYLVKMAKLDWQFADPLFRGTVFLPDEDSLPDSIVANIDIETARKIVKYHLMIGFFPKEVLFTSPYQQLQSSIKGQYFRAVIQGSHRLLLNEDAFVKVFNIRCHNGYIHILNTTLFPLRPRGSLPLDIDYSLYL